jgi:hypothetical protein
VTRQGDVSLTSDDVSIASLVLERQPVHGRRTWNETGIKGDRQRQIYRAVWCLEVGKYFPRRTGKLCEVHMRV